MCNIGPHLAFALDVRSKGYGRACPSLSTRVICHNIADLKLCSTKGYFVQLLGKSHRCFCWRDLEAEYLYSVSQSTIYTECIRYITFFVHLLVSKDYIHTRNKTIKDPAVLDSSLRIHKDTSFSKLIFISNCHTFTAFTLTVSIALRWILISNCLHSTKNSTYRT